MRQLCSRATSALLTLAILCALAPAARAAAPTATSFSTSVPANRQSVIQLQGADADGTSLYFAYLTDPAHGTLSNINNATGAERVSDD